MQAEDTLYTNAMRTDLPNRYTRGWSLGFDRNNGALEYLHALVFSFDDAIMHLDNITDMDLGRFRFELLVF